LGIPIIQEAAATSGAQSPSSIFPALKQATAARIAPKSLPVEPSKHQQRKTSSDVNQRLKRLEKQVKGRKKNKNWGTIELFFSYTSLIYNRCTEILAVVFVRESV